MKQQSKNTTEKTGARQVGIQITRSNRVQARVVQARGFKLRPDKSKGVVEIQLEQWGLKGERVSFDPIVVRTNLQMLKEYAAGLVCETDDNAMKDDIFLLSDADTYSNVLHLSQMAGRAETIFGQFRFADWVEASNASKGALNQVESLDALVVISAPSFQKKFVLELLSVLNENSLL